MSSIVLWFTLWFTIFIFLLDEVEHLNYKCKDMKFYLKVLYCERKHQSVMNNSYICMQIDQKQIAYVT